MRQLLGLAVWPLALTAVMVVGYGGPALGQNAEAAPLPIKVVIVTMFELGEDQGDRPGEFQTWVERLPLPERLPFPQGYRDLRINRAKGVLGIVTGIGTARSAASIMALGMDPRFDLRRAYWLVAGIAGADPDDMSIGSAAWAEWVIDGDLSHEIDPREIPKDWATGYMPLRHAEPYAQPVPEDDEGVVYRLDPDLVDWAYELTREVALEDSEALRALRERYVGHPAAQRPPFVLKGDNLASMTFWHGRLLNQRANDWIAYWTGGQGNFVTTAMEDTGTLQSLTFLDQAGRIDRSRILVLRTASNYSMQHSGITAVESLSGEKKGDYSAFLPSLEAAWRVGQPVVEELVEGWPDYAKTLPEPGQSRVSR
jgi:purine nucleoside permease